MRLAVYSLPSNELVPVIATRLVYVEFALRQPVSRLGARSGSRATNDFPHTHDPVFIVVHFKNKHGRPGAGSADPNVGGRAINTPGVVMSASPVYIFSPGRIIEYRARNVMIHVRKSVYVVSCVALVAVDSLKI